MFHIEKTITLEDYLAFNEYHLIHSKQGKKALLMFKILTPFLSFLAILVFWIAEADIDLIIALIITLSIVSIIMSFYSKKIWLKAIKNNIIKLEKDGKLPFEKVSTFILNDDCIIEKGAKTQTSIQYDAIEKIVCSDQAIYVYFSAIQAFVIPFRSFESDEHKNDFLAFLEEKSTKSLM